MSWHVLKLDLNSARWMPKLVSIDAQSYPALTLQSLRATIGPLQDDWPLFHYIIGISGILPYNSNVTLQTLELFTAYARLYNAASLPASRLRSAGSLATTRLSIPSKTMSQYYKRIGKTEYILTRWYYVYTEPYCFSGRRLVWALWLCRGLGQAWHLSAAKGVEKGKSKIKNGSSKNWSGKGKLSKDPCLSHLE